MPSDVAASISILSSLFLVVICQIHSNRVDELNDNLEPSKIRSRFILPNDVREDSIIVYSNYLFVRDKKNKTSSLINTKPGIVFFNQNLLGNRSKRSSLKEPGNQEFGYEQSSSGIDQGFLKLTTENRTPFVHNEIPGTISSDSIPQPAEDVQLPVLPPMPFIQTDINDFEEKVISNNPRVDVDVPIDDLISPNREAELFHSPVPVDPIEPHIPKTQSTLPYNLLPTKFDSIFIVPIPKNTDQATDVEIPLDDLIPPNREAESFNSPLLSNSEYIDVEKSILNLSLDSSGTIAPSKSSVPFLPHLVPKEPITSLDEIKASHNKYLNTLNEYSNKYFGNIDLSTGFIGGDRGVVPDLYDITHTDVSSKLLDPNFGFHDQYTIPPLLSKLPLKNIVPTKTEVNTPSNLRYTESDKPKTSMESFMLLSEFLPPLLEPVLHSYTAAPKILDKQTEQTSAREVHKSRDEGYDETDDLTVPSFTFDLPESEIPEEPTLPLPPLPPNPPPPPPVPKPSKVSQPTLPSIPTNAPSVPIPSLPVVTPPKFNARPTIRPTPPPPPPLNTHPPAIFAPVLPPDADEDEDDCQVEVPDEDTFVPPGSEATVLSSNSGAIQVGPTVYSKNIVKINNAELIENTYAYVSADNVPVRISVYTNVPK